jgi:hypothetical protein
MLRFKDPIWETRDDFLPLNRVEAAMWMGRHVKDSGGKLAIAPKAVAHAEGTNMVRSTRPPPPRRARPAPRWNRFPVPVARLPGSAAQALALHSSNASLQ